MGQNKALMPFLGRPLIARVVERVRPLAGELIVTTNEPQTLTFLNLPLFTDLLPGTGALGGLYTALAAASHPFVAVVACDMPFANPDLLQAQLAELQNTEADVVIPRLEDGYEPFHAVYRREPCLEAIAAALDAGQRRMISWFPSVKVLAWEEAELRRYDPDLLAFENVNTAEEFARAEARARELEDQSAPG